MQQQTWVLTLYQGPKSRIWLAEKREEGEDEEQRQLQSAVRFKQTQ